MAEMASSQKILVYGGKGALGSALVNFFKKKDWWVACIDSIGNDEANANIVIDLSLNCNDQNEFITKKVGKAMGDTEFDAIFCVAGGWAGGSVKSKDMVKNCDLMWKQSVWTSIIAAGLAPKFLKKGSPLVLTGASPALEGTPGMIGYGMAKSAVHQLVTSLSCENSGLPENCWVGAILPVTLDTPMNRKFMSTADFTSWTPLEFVAELFYDWTVNPESRPQTGNLIQLVTENNQTRLVPYTYKMQKSL